MTRPRRSLVATSSGRAVKTQALILLRLELWMDMGPLGRSLSDRSVILPHGAINWSSMCCRSCQGGNTRPYSIVMCLVMLKPGPYPLSTGYPS
jgi:hypothetical protein